VSERDLHPGLWPMSVTLKAEGPTMWEALEELDRMIRVGLEGYRICTAYQATVSWGTFDDDVRPVWRVRANLDVDLLPDSD